MYLTYLMQCAVAAYRLILCCRNLLTSQAYNSLLQRGIIRRLHVPENGLGVPRNQSAIFEQDQ
jgi:hypothetical protein